MPIAQPTFSKRPSSNGSFIHDPIEPVKVSQSPTDVNYRATAVETRFEDQPATISHIEGSPWVLELYLSQVLGADSAVQGQQMTTHAIHQQYHAIVGMELRVQSDLSHSQDEQSSESTLTGSAIVFPFLIPNKGDMFVAKMFDGSVGIFQVTRSERLSAMRDTAHSIDYILVGRNDKPRYEDLMRKIVRRSYFNRNFLYHGQNPILTEEAFDILQTLNKQFVLLGRKYFDQFFSTEYATLLLPGQMQPTYDPFLVRAVLGFADQRIHDRIKYIRSLNMQDDPVILSRSVWDVLRSMDRNQMHDIFQKAGTVDVTTFTKLPIFEGIRYSGVRRVVYPDDPPYNLDVERTSAYKHVELGVIDTTHRTREFESIRAKMLAEKQSLVQTPDETVEVTDDEVYASLGIKPAFVDDYYLFSKAFYENAVEGQSRLEVLVNEFIDNKPVNQQLLKEIAETSNIWSPLERYYYIPIVLILINSVIRML